MLIMLPGDTQCYGWSCRVILLYEETIVEIEMKKMKFQLYVGNVLAYFGLIYLFAILVLVWSQSLKVSLELFSTLVSFGITVMAVGLSYIGFYLAKSSDDRMRALTNSNYYEEMAMLEGYKIMYSKDETDKKTRIRKKVEYDIKAISELDAFLDDVEKIKERDKSREELDKDYLEGIK
jgi:uncharacterized protein YacL